MLNQVFGEANSQKISRLIMVSLGLFSIFLLVKVISDLRKLPNIGREIYPQSTIVVSGEGEAFAIPDIASFNFSVIETAEGVEDAQKMTNEKIAKAIDILKEEGVDEKDIKTTNYSVYPKYEWKQEPCAYGSYTCPVGENKLIGYETNQNILVKVRDLKKAGDLVGKIGALDISNISGLEFSVDDEDKYIAEAREQAIKKAKEQAKVISKQLGVNLGKVMYINETGNYMPNYYGGDMRMEASYSPMKVSLPEGESKITSSVTITYEIK